MKYWILSALLCCSNLHAAVIPAQSSLKFSFKQMGVSVEGSFSRFNARLAFDSKMPQQGQVQVDVDLTSVDAGSAEATDEVHKPAWFDAGRFATASFSARQFIPSGPNRYTARGELTLKGRKQPVVIPFTVKPAANGHLWLEGKTQIRRLAFNIGTGEWTDTGTVADEVDISFRLLYKP